MMLMMLLPPAVRFLPCLGALLVLLLGAPAPGVARAAPAITTYVIDTGHSAAHFSVRHLMIANVRGQLGPIRGSVRYDGHNVSSISAECLIDVNGINTHDPKRDEHLRSPEFFAVHNFPFLRFQSTRAEPAGPGRFKLRGYLTIRKITREVVLDVEGPSAPVRDGMGATHLGAVATTTISRKDFGLTWNRSLEGGGVLIGDEVKITIDLEVLERPDNMRAPLLRAPVPAR